MILILVLGENPMQISAETKEGYSVLIWTTALRSGTDKNANTLKSIYESFTVDNKKISCDQEISGTELNPKHFDGTEDLASKYDMIYVYFPSVALNENDIAVLRAYVKAGGRLVLQGEHSGYSPAENANLTALAKALGTSFNITEKNIGNGVGVVTEINLGADLLDGVPLNGDLSLYYFAEIEYDEPAEVIASYNGSAGIVDQAVENGRITVFSDVNFYDSSRATVAVKELLLRLLTNSIENKNIVKEGGDPNEDLGKECKLNATIEVEKYAWSSFLDEVLEVFFAQPQRVNVKAQDIKCGIERVEVLSSNTVLSEDEIAVLSDEDWTELEVPEGTGNFALDTEGSCIVYAKVTDCKGNEKVLSTDRIIIDMTAPVINGIEDGKFYCQQANFTVEDAYLASVAVDGNELEAEEDGTYTVAMTKDVHSIKAVDKAGNATAITINGGHVWNYEAVENKIYAKCVNSGCRYETEALCLQLNVKTPVDYTGEPYTQVTLENGITAVTGEVVGEIAYYKASENQELGEALSSPPTEAGKYIATITLGGEMAKAPFEIRKKCELNACIELEKYEWSILLDEVSEIFFAQPQMVNVNAQDVGCGIERVQVLSGNAILSEDEIAALSHEDWTLLEVTDGTGSFALDTEGSYIVYAKVTDARGNEKVLSTDRITIDMTAPIINGIEEEKFYCQSASFTVEDTYLASVTMDGNELEPDEEGTYHVDMTKDVHSIKAVDKAGNTTVITLKGGHVWNYEAVENKIYANCSNSGCKYESEALCLQLNAKTPVDYTGESYKQVTLENGITEVTGEVAGEIVYYKVGANQELGEALTAPPTEAGKYVATMTLGGKMAKAPFEIVAPITYYTVSFPGERIGYDVAIKEGYKNPVPCNGDYAFYVDVKPGYDPATLTVTANGKLLTAKNGLYTITGIGRDGRNVQVGITVLDRIAPTGTIQIQEDTWNVLQKNVDFDRFYTTAQTVEIKGLDLGVGVQSISYCITDKEITETEIDSLNWIPYKSKFAIHPNLRGYIYAKIVDKEGNTTYISTCGLIFEAPDGKEDVWKNEEVKKFEAYAYKQTTDEDLKGSFYNKIRARAVVKKKNKIQLKWNVVKDADGYIVYGNRCNTSKKKYKIKKLKTITDPYKTDWTHTKVKKGTYYKYTVAAYKVINGKKKVLSVSKMVHAVSKGGKYTNPTGVKVKKKTITLKVGKKKRIKATRTMPKGGKMKEHTKKFRYESSDKSVATINKKGVITAKKKGTCYGFVYVLNGTYTTVKIKVK